MEDGCCINGGVFSSFFYDMKQDNFSNKKRQKWRKIESNENWTEMAKDFWA